MPTPDRNHRSNIQQQSDGWGIKTPESQPMTRFEAALKIEILGSDWMILPKEPEPVTEFVLCVWQSGKRLVLSGGNNLRDALGAAASRHESDAFVMAVVSRTKAEIVAQHLGDELPGYLPLGYRAAFRQSIERPWRKKT